MWAKRAREEHDAFADTLREKGVTVHYFAQLLAETLEVPDGRTYILDRLCTPEVVGPTSVGPLRRLADGIDSTTLARYLIGGIIKADLHPRLDHQPDAADIAAAATLPVHVHGLAQDSLRDDDFVLAPLPNHLFQRDNSAWIYGGVSINPMAKPARQRETLHSRAIYRYHPLFAGAEFEIWYGGDDTDHLPASIEGGDIHVIGHGTVLIGMGERTTPDGGGDRSPKPCSPRARPPG